MSRPTYGYGADDPAPHDPAREPGEGAGGLPDLSGGTAERPVAGGSPQAGPGAGHGRPSDGTGQPGVGLPASEGPPTCPRHPDRISYVRCQRCGRPTCPECQRPAAVGVMCVDCAQAAQRQQRATAPRSAMGAPLANRPVVTYVVMGLCIAVFALQYLIPGSAALQLLAFAPFRALAMPWTFLTSGFLHGGVIHLLLNMYALYIVGGYLERVMGHWRFAGVYLVSMIAGHAAVLLLADPTSQTWFVPTVGASGGIFGLFGAMFIATRRMGGQAGQLLVLIGLNLVITFTIPNISWQGHLGGLVVGTALAAAMFALRPTARPGDDRVALARRAALLQAGVLLAGLALCAALVIIKVATVPAGALPLPGA